MNVLLACAAGMSTSLLVANMRKFAAPGDTIEAVSFSEVAERLGEFDVVLLGPQIRFRLAEAQQLAGAQGKPAGVIDMRVYGTMDGASALAQATSLLAA
ncbi:PTS sugar transporter subunit IIB [Cellulomonas soli]|uniref:PTS sugar transporter subunit IIB n=1 Tax=Cellulomonas soli TaxID=931535 RepID=UPI003F86BA09